MSVCSENKPESIALQKCLRLIYLSFSTISGANVKQLLVHLCMDITRVNPFLRDVLFPGFCIQCFFATSRTAHGSGCVFIQLVTQILYSSTRFSGWFQIVANSKRSLRLGSPVYETVKDLDNSNLDKKQPYSTCPVKKSKFSGDSSRN